MKRNITKRGLNHGCATHGHKPGSGASPTYQSWSNMKQRCGNPNHHKYPAYGSRGITYDPRWDSFENFLSDMGEKPDGMTLDRIDNDGDYTPENCRWATASEQALNTRKVTRVQVNGEWMSLRQAAKALGMHEQTLYSRLTTSWPLIEALSTPVGGRWR